MALRKKVVYLYGGVLCLFHVMSSVSYVKIPSLLSDRIGSLLQYHFT